MAPPPSSSTAVLHDEVTETDSVRGHLAFEVADRRKSESEIWNAVSRLADCYQALTLQQEKLTRCYETLCREIAWYRRRLWTSLLVACVAPLLCWILGAVVFRVLSL